MSQILFKSVDKFLMACSLVPSSRHLSNGGCLEDKMEDYQNCTVSQLCTIMLTHEQLQITTGLGFHEFFCICLN